MPQTITDTKALLVEILDTLSREELFALLEKLTQDAKAGDHAAIGKARVLLDLIPPEPKAPDSIPP